MTNQHAELSQLLAEQRITEPRQQAAHVQLRRGPRPPGRRRRFGAARGWWQLARWPGIRPEQPAPSPTQRQLIDREATMSKRTRALILAATLAAMNLAGLTAVAHAQANHDPDGKDARRLATERQAEEPRRHGQATADAALRRVLARERFSIPSQTPEQPTAPAPPEPSAQPNWLLASLGGFAAGLALAGGLAVLAARRTGRRARVGHAA
jgi:hypothetical protein